MPSPPAASTHDPAAWHDRAVWGIRFRGGSGHLGDWTSELELDFDSILDVRRDGDRTEYRVAPARLVFMDVTGLWMNIEWDRGREGRVIVHPPLIHVVERRPSEIGTGEPYWTWAIRFELNAEGEISFGAAGVREEVVAKPVVLLDRWYFSVSERARLLGA